MSGVELASTGLHTHPATNLMSSSQVCHCPFCRGNTHNEHRLPPVNVMIKCGYFLNSTSEFAGKSGKTVKFQWKQAVDSTLKRSIEVPTHGFAEMVISNELITVHYFLSLVTSGSCQARTVGINLISSFCNLKKAIYPSF